MSKIKNFVLDTNVLLHDPNALHKFDDNNVFIPIYVIEEIDNFKKDQSDLGRNARQVCRYLDEYREKGSLKDGVRMASGGILRVTLLSHKEDIDIGVADKHMMDNLIVNSALQVKKNFPDNETVFVSKDINLRIRADVLDLTAQNYEATSLPVHELYDLNPELETDADVVNTLYADGSVEFYAEHMDQHFLNQYLILKSNSDSKSALVRVTEINDFTIKVTQIRKFTKSGLWGIFAKNKEQQFAFDCLTNDKIQLVTLIGRAGCGKSLSNDSKILTPEGWTTMGELKLGQKVSTPDGNSANIIGLFPQGKLDTYKVIFTDGSSAECSEDHLWLTQTSKERDYKKPGSVRTLKEIMSSLRYAKNQKRNHSIPITQPVNFSEKDLPLDPYLLGCLIGDGGLTVGTPILANCDSELLNTCKNLIEKMDCHLTTKDGVSHLISANNRSGNLPKRITQNNLSTGEKIIYENINCTPTNMCYATIYKACKSGRTYKNSEWGLLDNSNKSTNSVKDALIRLDLWGLKSESKFIPQSYKFGSIEQRIALLQGLMDTDGTIGKNGEQSFTTTSEKLAQDFKELVQMLGGTVTTTSRYPKYTYKNEKKTGKLAYTCHICLPNEIVPFRLSRKIARIKPRVKYFPRRYVDRVEYIGKKECQCILIDSQDHLYLTDECIVTHNTLIALAAGLHQCLEDRKYQKLLVSRPVFPLGRDIGFLPGDIEEKMNPWMQPIFDNLEYLMGLTAKDKETGRSYRELLDLGTIEIEPLTYIRGRSIPNQYMIVDECLTKDTLILKHDGTIQNIDKIKENDYVHSYNLSEKHYQTVGVVDGTITRKTDKYYQIFTDGGYLEATPNHPLYVFNFETKEFGKKMVEDLREGDFLFSPREINHCVENSYSDVMARLDASFVCDMEKHEYHQRTPEKIWNAPLNTVKAYIEKCFSLLGHLRYVGAKNRFFYNIKTDNKTLVLELHLLLKKFGIQSKVGYETERTHSNWELILKNSSLYAYSKIIGLPLDKQRLVDAFFENYPDTKRDISRIPKMGGATFRYKVCERHLFDSEYRRSKRIDANTLNFFDTTEFISVRKIVPVFDEVDVYDFRVPNTGTFCANGVISSNCQNLSPHEVKTILTRAGEGTKIILTGDPYQIDNPYVDAHSNGLTYAVNRFRGQSIAANVTLQKGERSRLAELAANLL